jgi:hypothetical protein
MMLRRRVRLNGSCPASHRAQTSGQNAQHHPAATTLGAWRRNLGMWRERDSVDLRTVGHPWCPGRRKRLTE